MNPTRLLIFELGAAESDFTSHLHNKPTIPKFSLDSAPAQRVRTSDLAHFHKLKKNIDASHKVVKKFNHAQVSAIVKLYPVLNAQLKNAQSNLDEMYRKREQERTSN